MSNERYTIAPLKWQYSVSVDCEDWKHARWTADVPFGNYTVVEDWDNEEGQNETKIFWCYYFKEYYDENEEPCASVEDGKKLAEADWLNRILPALEKATEG